MCHLSGTRQTLCRVVCSTRQINFEGIKKQPRVAPPPAPLSAAADTIVRHHRSEEPSPPPRSWSPPPPSWSRLLPLHEGGRRLLVRGGARGERRPPLVVLVGRERRPGRVIAGVPRLLRRARASPPGEGGARPAAYASRRRSPHARASPPRPTSPPRVDCRRDLEGAGEAEKKR